MAGLRKLKGKLYARINYVIDGKRKEKIIPLHTKQEAKAKRLLPAIEERELLFKAGIISLDQITGTETPDNQKYIEDFLEYKQTKDGISSKSITIYNYALETLLDIFKDRSILTITAKDEVFFYAAMRKRFTNKISLNMRLKSIKTFFSWMNKQGYFEKLPFEITKVTTSKKNALYFSDQEMKQILEATADQPEFNATIKFYWKTGLRLRELENTYFHNGFIHIYKPMKNGEERIISIDNEVLKCYRIAKQWNITPNALSKKFRLLLQKLDLYYSRSGDTRHWHCLRDTFAVRKYYETRNIYEVSRLLGHHSVTVTESHYTTNNLDLDLLKQDFPDVQRQYEVKQVITEKPASNDSKGKIDSNYKSLFVN